ncbi:MAG: hypothetical protein ABI607_15505 [Betaproteobacteria bacterium]
MRKLTYILLLLVTPLLLAACQSTTINSAWFDPTFKGPPMTKIDVIAMGTNLSSRRVFEDIFAQQLRAVGVEGVAGWTVIPDEARGAQGQFTDAVAKTGAQGLLVVRLLGVDTRTQVSTTMTPGPAMMWGGPWGPSWGGFGPAMVPVTQVSQYDLAMVETTLFDTTTKQVVWSANTQTLNPRTVEAEAPGFSQLIIAQLTARGLIVGAKK